MANTFDFKLIIPGFADSFSAAEKLGRNDCLLTVALLAEILLAEHYLECVSRQGASDNITELHYSQYAIESRRRDVPESAPPVSANM